MKRSSSGTHIPVPKADVRQRSRSGVRTSNTLTSASKVRAGSCDRLTIPSLKRTNSSSNFKKSVAATPTLASSSKSYLNKKSTGLTPPVGLAGFKRSSNIVTPSSARSRSRSPYKIGSERTINDKKWVSQQFAKVRRYLQEQSNCPEHIPEILKPPTINTFVFVMNLLLKEIDPKTEMNNANYKEIVFNMLKILHYPGNISNSLLKTVNTMHAWPQVVSIFGWLVDLVSIIKRVDKPNQKQDPQHKKVECVTNYIVERYLRYNNNEEYESVNQELVENFAQILNIDEEEIKQLEEEVTTLSQLKEKQLKTITEQKSKNDEFQNEINLLQNEIDTFYLNREEKQEDINDAIASVKERRAKLVETIEAKRASIAKLTEVIKVQPCTVQEKKIMLKHINEMKHTIDLKKEKLKAQKSIKDHCDLQLIEARKKVETEVYRLNNSLMKLALKEPDLKILQLKETDFLSTEFEKVVQSLGENIEIFGHKFNTEIEHLKHLNAKMATEISTLEQQIESSNKTVQKLTECEHSISNKIEICNKEMEAMTKKREEQKQSFLQKMKELKSVETDVSQVQQKLQEVTELKNKKEAHFETIKEQSLAFFVKVHDSVMDNLVNMNNIRNDVFDVFSNRLNQINQNQNEICEDLQKLEELQE